jgi:hypothetical protein
MKSFKRVQNRDVGFFEKCEKNLQNAPIFPGRTPEECSALIPKDIARSPQVERAWLDFKPSEETFDKLPRSNEFKTEASDSSRNVGETWKMRQTLLEKAEQKCDELRNRSCAL